MAGHVYSHNNETMVKYNKTPINDVLYDIKQQYNVMVFDKFPSITIIKK